MKKSEGDVMRGKNIRLLLSCTAFLFFCMLACVVGVASAKTIYVPDDYAKIQWAVDNASEGDTIIVRPGTYIENIDVDKSVDIRSYSQNPADTIVIANNPDDHVFYVSANNVNITGFTVTGAGIWKAGVYLDNSDYSKIENVNASNNWLGIYLSSSNNNTLANNTASSNNWLGIYLSFSNNTIANNNASNNYFGIYLYHSNNIIYLNNFINNTYQVSSSSSTNIWNSTEKITYTYKGKTYENYLGNYWDDYNGSDANGDGIGDVPYSINADRDNYPLIERFENYFMPTPAQTFDTGRPENPYPSISGKFIGTIKTDTKIIATKLYTYACEGTGGHTEHALICNSTWCAEAKWEGYKRDWKNITFNTTVVLMPYETYNFTIITGSYPQIHHRKTLPTENGWINCTSFVDANGKVYYDWISAIRLG